MKNVNGVVTRPWPTWFEFGPATLFFLLTALLSFGCEQAASDATDSGGAAGADGSGGIDDDGSGGNVSVGGWRAIDQFGTMYSDQANAVTVDESGNIYVAGATPGSLPGQTGVGASDAFVRKYDSTGEEQWTRQFGTGYDDGGNGHDAANSVAVDGSAKVYVAGKANGTLPNQVANYDVGAFLRKYDSSGEEQWTRQFEGDATSVALDESGSAYVTGSWSGNETTSGTYVDVFVRKYDSSGEEQWTRQLGTSRNDYAQSLRLDGSGNVYVVGFTTDGALPGQTGKGSFDAFVLKYDRDGEEQWTRQFGTSGIDEGFSVATDESGIYVVGYVDNDRAFPGETSAGARDAFVVKYNHSGEEQWTRQFGTIRNDQSTSVATDDSGVYVEGYIAGSAALSDQTNVGFYDAFVRKYDSSGEEQWTSQFGTDNDDTAHSIFVDKEGKVYVAGGTAGTFAGQMSSGASDAYVLVLEAP